MYRFLSTILLFLSAIVSSAADRPNIIYILADDAGYGDFGCNGGTALPTPHVDRMAAEGMKFTRHYAGCTVCAPSRCVLMTGLHTGHCRVRGNSDGLLHADDITIAEVLKSVGYQTACIGKWGIGKPPALDEPNTQGFDEFFGYVSMWHAHNFYPEFLIRNGKEHRLRNVLQPRWKGQDGRGVAEKKVDYAPDLLTEEALEFIRKNRERPFFLYFALNVPHANNEGGRFNDGPEKGMEVPDFGPYADMDWPGPEKGFAAIMHNIDRDVGRILMEIAALGLDENTLVMFSSDNGPHQEGGHRMEFFDSNGSLRGMKRDLYEGGIRVPLIARWPGRIPPNRTSDLLSGFQDLLPTFASVAGAQYPDGLDGISMLAELTGNSPAQPKHDYLYWEFSEQKGKRAVMRDNWKVVQRNVATDDPLPLELYNLATDEAEQRDVAAQNPDIVAELRQLMDNAHRRSPDYPLFPDEKPVP